MKLSTKRIKVLLGNAGLLTGCDPALGSHPQKGDQYSRWSAFVAKQHEDWEISQYSEPTKGPTEIVGVFDCRETKEVKTDLLYLWELFCHLS